MSSSYPSSVFRPSAAAAEPILSANLAEVRGRMRKLSAENRWAIAGLLLALVMVVMLYFILVDNVAQLQNKRLAQEQQAQERHRCAMLRDRLERDQCLVALQQPASDEGLVNAVMAQR